MSSADFVLYEEEFKHLEEALRRLRQEANAKAVFLIDKNGQQIASAGSRPVRHHVTRFPHRRQRGRHRRLAKLIGEREFSCCSTRATGPHPHLDRGQAGDPGGHLRRPLIARSGPPARQAASVDLEKIFEIMLQKSERGAGTAHARAPFPRSPTTTSMRSSASSRGDRRRVCTQAGAQGTPAVR